MNAIDLLKMQHDEVKDLFEELGQAEDSDEKQDLFEELADNLAAHATIEEQIFYPAAYAEKTKELLTEAVEEHLAIKRIIADLLELEPDDEHFDAKIAVLKEQVEHHVEEEERDLFDEVRRELDTKTLESLGSAMSMLFEQEMRAQPREKVPEETEEAAPIEGLGGKRGRRVA